MNSFLNLPCKDLGERVIGEAVIEGAWLPLAPFYKRLNIVFANQLRDPSRWLLPMLALNPTCPADDPTAIIERYLNPWWETETYDDVHIIDGLDRFAGNVSSINRLAPVGN